MEVVGIVTVRDKLRQNYFRDLPFFMFFSTDCFLLYYLVNSGKQVELLTGTVINRLSIRT